MKNYVAIIDLGLSNLYNVKLALEKINIDSKFVSNENELNQSKAFILPGVGSFKAAMQRVKDLNLENPIKKNIAIGKPFLGICLGMQILFSVGEEHGITKGLNVFPGSVKKFKYQKLENDRYSVPHMGWNVIKTKKKNSIFSKIKKNEFMYFVHSYYVDTKDKKIISSTTSYGDKEFCSSISYKNIFACQFHPERSGKVGKKILQNFKKII